MQTNTNYSKIVKSMHKYLQGEQLIERKRRRKKMRSRLASKRSAARSYPGSLND